MVEPGVYEALAKPLVGHLDPYFIGVLDQVREMLRSAFGTRNPLTWAISGTGSSGMETAIANFVEPDSKFAVLGCGFFGSRMAEMGRRQGARVVSSRKAVGRGFRLRRSGGVCSAREARGGGVCARRDFDRRIAGPAADHQSRARSGRADHRRLRDVARRRADFIGRSGHRHRLQLLAERLELSSGPGAIHGSPRAVERLNARKTPVPEWYLDLRLLGEYFDGHKYHHTASATLFYALHESLRLIHEEGLENRFARHRSAHQALVRGFEDLGLRMHVPEGHRIPHLNTPRVPEGVDDAKVRKHLLEKNGIEIAGGFGPLAGKIFRIGLMGPMANQDCVEMFLGQIRGSAEGDA